MTISEARSAPIQASSAAVVQHRDFDRSAVLWITHSVGILKKTGTFFSILSRLQAIFIAHLTDWKDRQRSRSELLTLSDHDLLDIGISWGTAKFEGRKPFWRP
jgi:uncharacterized protein YjiS (DUF1127 family)